ncbi:helix-turn-helix transcriptional regulator [Chromobacterium sp. ASV23]|uniref:helix-turn-helix domain-containing protein n=1 Tax=Chromobacterium sp. ASV23 TaxID=2795110 RepID=UPI0018EACB89|nr:helix-turn-helix transcriptional regulator [Chromobacterium sp. ASV23]
MGESQFHIPHRVIQAVVDGAAPVKAWREYLGFTEVEMAERLDIEVVDYRRWESTQQKSDYVIQIIAVAMGIHVSQLDF